MIKFGHRRLLQGPTGAPGRGDAAPAAEKRANRCSRA
jgi:hypothetical protein